LTTAIAEKSIQDLSKPLQDNSNSKKIYNDFNQEHTRKTDTRHSKTPTASATKNPPQNNPIGNNSTTSNHFLNRKIPPENIYLLLCLSFKDKRNYTVSKPTIRHSNQIIGNQVYTIHSMSSFFLDVHQSFIGKIEAACYYDQQGNLCKIQSKTWTIMTTEQPTGVKKYSFHDKDFILKEFKNNE
jgi:hypothetical protein